MKRTTFWLIIITLSTIGSFGALVYYSLQNVFPHQVPIEAAEGKELWKEYSCVQCHAIVGNGGYSAPDLTDVVSRRSEEWLQQFFLDPPIMRPSKDNRHMGLDPQETENMLYYLHFVNEIYTNNWPPDPLISDKEDA